MHKLYTENLEFISHTIEYLMYKTNSFEKNYFFSKIKSKGIKKIIFIVKHFNKDLEHFSIQCIQNNLNVIILFHSSLQNKLENLWQHIPKNETVLLVFSQHCQDLKEKIQKIVDFDPIRDDLLQSPHYQDTTKSKNREEEVKIKIFKEHNHVKSDQVSIQKEDKEELPSIDGNKDTKDIKPSMKPHNDIGSNNKPKKNDSSVQLQNIELKAIKDKENSQKPPNTSQLKEKKDEETTKTIETKEASQSPSTSNVPSSKNLDNKSDNKKRDFKPSKLTIRIKLLSITALLITFSLSTMIFFASYFFKRDIETQIQTNNTGIVNILSQKIEDLIFQLNFNAELILESSHQNQFIVNLGLFDNPYLFSIALITPIYNNFKIQRWYTNEILLQQNALLIQDFENIISLYKEDISLSLTGVYNVLNISPNFNLPILLLIAPVKNSPGELLLIFINAKKLINDLPVDENSKTFVVNRNGIVLIYPELNIVQLAPNLQDMPIVKMMLESKLDNGLTTFKYKNKEYLGAFRKISIASIGVITITESEKAFEPVFATQRRNFYILGIVLIITIFIVYFFSKTISQPIKELAVATEKVEEEDYSVRVKPKSRDEIGLLAYSFNKMVKGLEERERMKDAFGRFVNKEVAEKALRGEIKLGGEKKYCAVFFSDLRGFTAMSEKMKPESVVEYLNRYFTIMVDCVEKTHGVVDKFIGDAVMATWGAVTQHGNDAENAVNGALLMRKALIEFNKYNKQHNHPIAKFGCGINYGEVISGQIGSEKRLEFTVIGDTVNLASRIEGLNKPFATDILISQDTYERVKDIFDVVKMPAIKVKGKSEPQTIYCVLGRKDDPTRPKNLQELRKLVGIDWEPQVREDTDFFGEDKEEKYEILKHDGIKK